MLGVGAEQERRIDVAAEAHRLRPVEEGQRRLEVHLVAGCLEVGRQGRNPSGHPQEQVQRKAGAFGQEQLDAGLAENVGDLMGVLAQRQHAPGHDGPSQLAQGEVRALDVDMGVDEPWSDELSVELQLRPGRAVPAGGGHGGDALPGDHHVGREQLTRRHAHDHAASQHEVGGLLAQRNAHQASPVDGSTHVTFLLAPNHLVRIPRAPPIASVSGHSALARETSTQTKRRAVRSSRAPPIRPCRAIPR